MLKRIAWGASIAFAFPEAAVSGFGRWRPVYTLFAQAFALAPGLPGDYLRLGFYRLTLSRCSLASRISFGTIFSHPRARLGPGVYIGAYCIVGMADIGANCQIASGVQILSGRHQHVRTGDGISGAEQGAFTPVSIGRDCWIGAGSIVMADVGDGTTIGAGSVVTRPLPAHCVAVGNPARVRQHHEASSGAADPAGVSNV